MVPIRSEGSEIYNIALNGNLVDLLAAQRVEKGWKFDGSLIVKGAVEKVASSGEGDGS